MNAILKTISIFIIIFCVSNIYSQDFVKNSRTEQYRLPQLPNLYKYFDKDYAVRDNPNSVLKQDFFLTLRDNVQMDASKFYPSEANPYLPNGYPVVIMVHGYGDRKETLENFALAQASYGYVVYTYSVRGQGNSGGLSNLISRTEAQDLIEFVNYVKHDNTATGSDSSNVLIMGGSQGGTLPYMAASMGMNVKAIISALASPEFGTSWIENGCVKMTMLWTSDYTSDTARYTPLVSRFPAWIYSNAADKWDSLAYWVPLNRDFKSIIANNRVPMLLENSWQDMFFNALGNINGISLLTAPSRYYFGAVTGHGGDTSPTEDTWHMNFFNEWFFYWLFGIENNILTRPKYHYAYTSAPITSSGTWSFVHDSSTVFPPAGVNNFRLYFNTNKKLKKTVNPLQTQYVTITNTVKSGYTLEKAVMDEFKGSTFKAGFKKDSTVFDSDILTSDAKLIGTPSLKLDYYSNVNACQYNFQIFEVNSAGVSKFVTSINYTDRKNVKNTRRQKVITGNSHAHIFKAGSKIRIILTNLDQRWNYPFLGTNPFVLPVVASASNRMYLSSNSYIDMPIIGTSPLMHPMLSGPEGTEPTVFALSQNYPNPFNPVTKISFNLPKDFSGNVTLKIFDMTGKEVAQLMNESLTTGLYEARWDASKFSSGIYFYKLTAGSFSDVKKMILVK
ncbi:MAG: alpha/beta fold hydrolase [Ignavibacteria bacterium]|nr:alpha/beta fold hydrolase [Ignavibacteria bacterium]